MREDALIRGANRGKFNVLADPRFVDPANGDYRLLPDSPAALYLKDKDGRPAGAFPVAPADAIAKVRPTLQLSFRADTMPYGKTGVLTFDRDPWIGGGTTRIRDLTDSSGPARRMTGTTNAVVELRAFDATGKIVKTRFTLGAQPPQEIPYTIVQNISLPDKDGEYRVRFEVQNDRGVWSEPATALLRLERTPPALVGDPEVMANDHGLIVTFKTTLPSQCEVQFGLNESYGRSVKSGDIVKRYWVADDGGEWIDTWVIPQTNFALAILKPEVEAGQTVHFRIVLTGESGVKSESKDFSAKVQGKNRSVFVSPAGEDKFGRGTKDAPLRTVQYAVDRALPGDRVILMPGLYAEGVVLTHGGVSEEARLTLEAESPNTVTIDIAKREYNVLTLEKSGYTTIRNIRCLSYERNGVYVYRSPHVTVEGCTFVAGRDEPCFAAFFFWSPHSTVTRCLAIGGRQGLEFLKSSFATVTYNTISKTIFGGVSYDFSLAGSVQMNNCLFCSGGISMFSGDYQHPDEQKTSPFRSDYNNLATSLTAHRAGHPAELERVKPQEIKIDYPREAAFGGSKHVVNVGKNYDLLKDWQRESGQDQHSIFADPKFVKPYGPIDSWDWGVKPDSPHVGAGENGTTIGALGVKEQNGKYDENRSR
jgi:hypothetical protein